MAIFYFYLNGGVSRYIYDSPLHTHIDSFDTINARKEGKYLINSLSPSSSHLLSSNSLICERCIESAMRDDWKEFNAFSRAQDRETRDPFEMIMSDHMAPLKNATWRCEFLALRN